MAGAGVLCLHVLIGVAAGIASMVLARAFKDSYNFECLHTDFLNKMKEKSRTRGLPLLFIPFVLPSFLIFAVSYLIGFLLCVPFCLKISFSPFRVFISKKVRKSAEKCLNVQVSGGVKQDVISQERA
jgi:hypothetical protein